MLSDIQKEAAAEEAMAIARQLMTDDARAPILFDHVMLFDADGGAFVPDQAVMVEDGKIVAVGPAGSIAPVEGARLVDGRGKTLVPGLWDAHAHFDGARDLLARLSWGQTSARSPGTRIEDYLAAREGFESGRWLTPEPFAAQLVDGVHPLSSQSALRVDSQEEAIAAVHEIHDAGMWGVKFYGSFNRDWLAATTAEAKRLGMHVAGHIPAGMRPLEAVRAGYDEITHINFVAMQMMPQSVVDTSNTAARLEGPAQYAQNIDLDGPEMTAYIAELAERGTIVDPTLYVFEAMLTHGDAAEMPAAFVPFVGTMPAAMERGYAVGGFPLFEGVTRDDFLASWTRMNELVKVLHDAGVPLVAGTDGSGMELVRELELYEEAGLSKEEALRSATIVPAWTVGADDRTGSIRVGKEADLLLVDGDVSEDLGSLRRVELVVHDGYALDGDALRTASGYSGMPQ